MRYFLCRWCCRSAVAFFTLKYDIIFWILFYFRIANKTKIELVFNLWMHCRLDNTYLSAYLCVWTGHNAYAHEHDFLFFKHTRNMFRFHLLRANSYRTISWIIWKQNSLLSHWSCNVWQMLPGHSFSHSTAALSQNEVNLSNYNIVCALTHGSDEKYYVLRHTIRNDGIKYATTTSKCCLFFSLFFFFSFDKRLNCAPLHDEDLV